MRKQPTLKRRFINDVYNGDYKQYLRERREDYCKVQFAWSCYIDALCKDGQITQAQYDRAVFQKGELYEQRRFNQSKSS